jgi:hypothetical protein
LWHLYITRQHINASAVAKDYLNLRVEHSDTRSKWRTIMLTNPILTVALGAVVALGIAAPADARINQRQAHQQQRIATGLNNGSLNAREAVRLERQQVHIARYEARNRADGGGLNARERARLEHMQDHASKRIYVQKHDAR